MSKKTKKDEAKPMSKKREVLTTSDSYKSLLYGVVTVIILFIIGFGTVKLLINRPTPAIDDKAFEYLDAAIVSIHSSFKTPIDKMTERVIKGLEHPKAKILAQF